MDASKASIPLLTAWVDQLYDAIYRMRVDQHIFTTVFRIIAENSDLASHPSHFYVWMNDNYVERIAMAVRRLRDPRRKTISLTNLLRRIGANPSLVSRAHYRAIVLPSMPGPPGLPKDVWTALATSMVNRQYDAVVGAGLDAPTIEQLDWEIAWLETLGDPVVTYATKLIAHHDEAPPAMMPTLGDIDAFIDYAEGLVKKYILLIKGIDAEFHVIFNYNWLRPLEYAWLNRRGWSGSADQASIVPSE